MNTQKSAVALRFIIVSALTGVDGDSLDQLNTSELPDGALVSVIAGGGLYRLNKTSVATTLSPGVIAAGSGPGAYVYVSGADTNPFAVSANGTAALAAAAAFAEVGSTWIACPSGAGFYASGVASSLFTLNTTSGILTYAGPPKEFAVNVSATVAASVAGQSVELHPSVNGALIGTTTFAGAAGVANVPPTTANLGTQLSSRLNVQIPTGATIQAIVRDTSASNNIAVSHLSLHITAL